MHEKQKPATVFSEPNESFGKWNLQNESINLSNELKYSKIQTHLIWNLNHIFQIWTHFSWPSSGILEKVFVSLKCMCLYAFIVCGIATVTN